jgi:hypothetical protein
MRQVAALMSALFGVAGCSQILGLDDTVLTDPNDANIVFVTSTMQAANYGGLAGADNLCQTRARAAGLAGTYVAWLSTGTTSAVSRLGTATGWKRRDGLPVANMPADLVAHKMFYPIRLTESGTDVFESVVHTATTDSGALNPGSTTCSGYTSADSQYITTGFSSGTSSLFTAFDSETCATPERLYCFGVSKQSAVAVEAPPMHRRAFLTSGDWLPGGKGILSADELCASEALASGLLGTYMALLATTTASADSRFDKSGDPWIRSDGVQLAPTAAMLFSSEYWDSALTTHANGSYALGDIFVASGATSLTVVGTAMLTCNNWMSSTGTVGGGLSGATRVGTLFAKYTNYACSANIKLACLQK